MGGAKGNNREGAEERVGQGHIEGGGRAWGKVWGSDGVGGAWHSEGRRGWVRGSSKEGPGVGMVAGDSN